MGGCRKTIKEKAIKKILVIGLGFIGRHLVQKLIEENCRVTIMDRAINKKNLWELSELEQVVMGDVRNRESTMEAIYHYGQDGVVNLAGILGTQETIENPHPSIDTNIHGAVNVFEACIPCNMYPKGIRAVQITVGNYWMQNSYAITKSAAERMALMFNKEMDTKISVVRGFNAYGPHQKHAPIRKIIPNFVMKALNKLPIEIYGNGTQIMDMIFVEDLAELLVRTLTWKHNIYDRVIEGGTGRKTTVKFIAETINRIVGSNAGLKFLPMRPGEEKEGVVLANTDIMGNIFDMQPEKLIPLEIGIQRTVDWYRTYYPWQGVFDFIT